MTPLPVPGQQSINVVLPDELYIGNLTSALSHEIREQNGITHIVSVCLANQVDLSSITNDARLKGKHLHISVEDTEYADLLIHLPKACRFIEDALKDSDSRVLVHCVMGISRSTTIVAAYLMKTKKLSSTDAIALVRESRPTVHPNYGFMKQLDVWAECEYLITSKHPTYVSWRRTRKQDIANFLTRFCDVTSILDDDTLFLSSDFPTNKKQAEALVLDLEITHIMHASPSSIPFSALELLRGYYHIKLEGDDHLCVELPRACSFIQDALDSQPQVTEDGIKPKVLVHCDIECRACIIVAAYLMSSRNLTTQDSSRMLCSALPLFDPTRNFKKQLQLFEACEYNPSPDHPLLMNVKNCTHPVLNGAVNPSPKSLSFDRDIPQKSLPDKTQQHKPKVQSTDSHNSHLIAHSIKHILTDTDLENRMGDFSEALKGLQMSNRSRSAAT